MMLGPTVYEVRVVIESGSNARQLALQLTSILRAPDRKLHTLEVSNYGDGEGCPEGTCDLDDAGAGVASVVPKAVLERPYILGLS